MWMSDSERKDIENLIKGKRVRVKIKSGKKWFTYFLTYDNMELLAENSSDEKFCIEGLIDSDSVVEKKRKEEVRTITNLCKRYNGLILNFKEGEEC